MRSLLLLLFIGILGSLATNCYLPSLCWLYCISGLLHLRCSICSYVSHGRALKHDGIQHWQCRYGFRAILGARVIIMGLMEALMEWVLLGRRHGWMTQCIGFLIRSSNVYLYIFTHIYISYRSLYCIPSCHSHVLQWYHYQGIQLQVYKSICDPPHTPSMGYFYNDARRLHLGMRSRLVPYPQYLSKPLHSRWTSV